MYASILIGNYAKNVAIIIIIIPMISKYWSDFRRGIVNCLMARWESSALAGSLSSEVSQ